MPITIELNATFPIPVPGKRGKRSQSHIHALKDVALQLRFEHLDSFNKEIAAGAGIGESTLYRWLQTDRAFLSAWIRVKELQLLYLDDLCMSLAFSVAIGELKLSRRELNRKLWSIERYLHLCQNHPRNLICGSPRA